MGNPHEFAKSSPIEGAVAVDGKIPVYLFHPDPSTKGRADAQRRDDGVPFFYLPLALGLVVERARAANQVAGARYDFDLPAISTPAALLETVRDRGPGVCLFSSYVWTVDQNLEVSRALRVASPDTVIIHGGPSTPRLPEASATFLREHRSVDVIVRGEGEETLAALLPALAGVVGAPAAERRAALRDIAGLCFLGDDDACVRTPDRPLVDDLDSLPSPYLTGYFDRLVTQRAAAGAKLKHATLETNRGCPYGCAFCDWGSATLQKIRSFGLERIRREAEWIGRQGIHEVFIADANFGILKRDVEVAEILAETRRKLGYPRSLTVNYTKNGAERLARIFDVWRAAGIGFDTSISLQTVDPETLAAIDRANIEPRRYASLSDVYRRMSLPVRVQLMPGLPGQTLASWKNDLQFCFDRGESAQIFTTRLLPNSPMADPAYRARHEIRTDGSEAVVETATFSEDDWREMHRIAAGFILYHNWGILRQLLLHLQLDHGVRAVDLTHAHVDAVRAAPEQHPACAALLGPILETPPLRIPEIGVNHLLQFYERGWGPVVREVGRFAVERFGVPEDLALEVALRVQEARLPRKGGPAVRDLPLEHDFATYVQEGEEALRAEARPLGRLSEFGPATLRVSDPLGLNRGLRELPALWTAFPGIVLPAVLVAPSSAVALTKHG